MGIHGDSLRSGEFEVPEMFVEDVGRSFMRARSEDIYERMGRSHGDGFVTEWAFDTLVTKAALAAQCLIG